MIIEQDHVVSFHFDLYNTQGELLESSKDGHPVLYLQGAPGMLPGLVDAFEGKQKGDSFDITLPPAKAFGEKEEGNTARVPLKHVRNKHGKAIKGALAAGSQVQLHTKEGIREVTVIKKGLKAVDVDLNHPHAGLTVKIDVEILT